MSAQLDDILKTSSLEELMQIRAKVEEHINRARRAEQNTAKKKILALAATYGINVNFAETAKASSKSKLPPKYKNPRNPQQTWAGHGRKPDWLEELLAKGHKLKEFEILIQVQ